MTNKKQKRAANFARAENAERQRQVAKPQIVVATEQDRARQGATNWTQRQADRLGISADEVLDAIMRGWLSEDIGNLTATNVERQKALERGLD